MIVRILVVGVILAIIVLAGGCFYYERFVNPGVARELADDPNGERAQKVMLLTLPSGRELPCNYLREGNRVYAGADGRWWKELVGEHHRVSVLIKGERLTGRARAVLDDPKHTKDVFSRLRPNALPGFGTLIEIEIEIELDARES